MIQRELNHPHSFNKKLLIQQQKPTVNYKYEYQTSGGNSPFFLPAVEASVEEKRTLLVRVLLVRRLTAGTQRQPASSSGAPSPFVALVSRRPRETVGLHPLLYLSPVKQKKKTHESAPSLLETLENRN